ncbi:TetR/AcrR family transcriptional regulator [Aminipila luticellarii]|uniref:TetR/AcrR family transcriptional regulator n=1 Tax=Aminipila luticellarii TaxID=2507160 RepID=A0A410PTE9_9FIRM|nr:TetR/AcrR family transcriptional regulator [Aminipila luticellarii]QAT42205.1 TetR/AcrR family transcriptional regulator [Aminipila luticellarii]
MARNKYPEITVNRILDTAMKLFMTKGYEHTTVQDIINELGDLSKGAIYHHFKSKEDIMGAVNNRMLKQGLGSMQTIAADNSLTGIEKLHKVLLFSISSAKQEAIDSIMPSFMKNPQLLALHMRDTLGSASNLFVGIIEDGLRDCSIHTSQPRELSQMILLCFNVWINPWMYSWKPEEIKNIVVFIKNTFEQIDIPIMTPEIIKALEELYAITGNEK